MNPKKHIDELDNWINIIESQLKVFTHISCQEIYILLRIYGKKTASELMAELSYSRGAIFTALNLLQEARYIRKVEDPTIPDKRKNTYYYAIDKTLEIVDDQQFLNYVVEQKKLKLYLKWIKKSVAMSTSMIEIAYQLAIKPKMLKLRRMNQKDLSSESVQSDSKYPIITYSELGSIDNQNKLKIKITQFLKELEEEFTISEASMNPIQNPTLFSLFYIPLH